MLFGTFALLSDSGVPIKMIKQQFFEFLNAFVMYPHNCVNMGSKSELAKALIRLRRQKNNKKE